MLNTHYDDLIAKARYIFASCHKQKLERIVIYISIVNYITALSVTLIIMKNRWEERI